MASVFPYTNGTATTDSFNDPLSTSPLNSPSHSTLHQDINTAVETIEAVLQSGGGSRNLLYNGAMQVAQRGTSTASITTTGYYTVDRWKSDFNSLGTWTQSVENDAPTGSSFRKSLKMLCTTADASPAAGDYHQFYQVLEGQDLQAFRKGTSLAQQFTVSFWVKANVTGTYIFELYDADNTRQVSKSYTISASGTWEFKTLTLPADTTGAFDNDTAASLYCVFWLGAGSNSTSGTLNTSWATLTQANRAVGQVNLASSTNNYWQITGVQLNVGSVAAPFEFKSFTRELAECQRYYEKSYSIDVAPGTNTTQGVWYNTMAVDGVGNLDFDINFCVPKRSTTGMTVAFYQSTGTAGSWNYGRSGATGTTTINFNIASTNRAHCYGSPGGSWAACWMYGHWVANAEL